MLGVRMTKECVILTLSVTKGKNLINCMEFQNIVVAELARLNSGE